MRREPGRYAGCMTDRDPGSLPQSQVQDLLRHSEDITVFVQEFSTELAERLSAHGEQVACAVSLLREKRTGSAAASGPQAQALDELQSRFTAGPCLTAISEDAITHVADTLDDPRWPDYLPVAAAHGVRSILGVPFELGDEEGAGAALNVYSSRPDDFSDETIDSIRREVHRASSALQLAVRLTRHRETEENLRAAMASRTPIDLAVGIIMGQNRCTQAEAVEILKTASNHRNVKLRDLAAELVSRANHEPARTHYET